MCGIIGYSGKFTPEQLAEGNRLQCHRGPDDCGVFFDAAANLGLGHLRLSIIDTSALGRQPMIADEGPVALSTNGEIYNYRELRAELESRGHRFRSQSDTEVMLRLY